MTIEAGAAAVWSAVAASVSALAAFFAMGVQRANRRDAARPDLLIGGWERTTRGGSDIITYSSVRNVGRGAAYHINIDGDTRFGAQPVGTIVSQVRLPILGPGEEAAVEGKIVVSWLGVDLDKSIVLVIHVNAWDSLNFHHRVKYDLLVERADMEGFVANEIAPRVMLLMRWATFTSPWRLRFRRLRYRFQRAVGRDEISMARKRSAARTAAKSGD